MVGEVNGYKDRILHIHRSSGKKRNGVETVLLAGDARIVSDEDDWAMGIGRRRCDGLTLTPWVCFQHAGGRERLALSSRNSLIEFAVSEISIGAPVSHWSRS
jgi:hypothetical protein